MANLADFADFVTATGPAYLRDPLRYTPPEMRTWLDFVAVAGDEYRSIPNFVVEAYCPRNVCDWNQRARFCAFRDALFEMRDIYLGTHAETPWRLAS